MPSKQGEDWRNSGWYLWLRLVWVVVFVAIDIYDRTVREPRARQAQVELEAEFQRIAPLPGSIQLNAHSSDGSATLVGATYASDQPYAQIRDHYDADLTRLGWQRIGERPVRYRGQDLGGRSVRYCKGEYSATLQYAGEEADFGWAFALDLSWGLRSCQDMD